MIAPPHHATSEKEVPKIAVPRPRERPRPEAPTQPGTTPWPADVPTSLSHPQGALERLLSCGGCEGTDAPKVGRKLLGLYQWVPLTRRSTFYAGALPDRITIYCHAICSACDSESEVVEQVRRTVVHELGHHFGIGDARLRELGW